MLVLSIDREPWRTIEREGQRRTWAAADAVPAGCRVVFYDGRPGAGARAGRVIARLARTGVPPFPAAFAAVSARAAAAPARAAGDRLLTAAPEAFAFTLPKLLAALRWAAGSAAGSFDYVYRTNTSSYVRLARLQAAAAALPRSGCYAGWLGRTPAAGPPFVKGAGILLSRDVAAEVARHHGPWPWGAVDDAAVGAFLAGRGFEAVPLHRGLLRSPDDVAALPEDELRKTFLFRCKSQGGARVDHLTMQALHARLRAVV